MKIKDSLIWEGKTFDLVWSDCDSFDDLPIDKCQQIYGVCFFKDEIVITRGKGKKVWNLVGGHIEQGEIIEDALIREVQEESNMKVLKHLPIGYQEVLDKKSGTLYFQLRSLCLVEPIGKFEKDPAGSVEEMKLIDPKDSKKYFDWGKIGERLIERALISKNMIKLV